MPIKPNPWMLHALGALICLAVPFAAGAQQVYKCGSRYSVTYTEKPCAGRMVSTEQAPVRARSNPTNVDAHRLEQARVVARALQRRPGESKEQFDTRRRRAAMLAPDRAECARLDTRMPVEAASLTNPDPAEVQKAQAALHASQKRFGDMRC